MAPTNITTAAIVVFLIGTICAFEYPNLHSATIAAPVCPPKPGALSRTCQIDPLLLEDKSATHTWAPWSYRPRCVAQNKPALRDRGDRHRSSSDTSTIRIPTTRDGIKYCLLTNTFFGDYGISVLARTEATADIASMIWNAYQSSFPSYDTVQYLNMEPAYQVVDMPNKGGKGVVATRHIKRRETFMVDYAAIMGDLRIWGCVALEEGRSILDLAAQQLVNPHVVTNLSHGAGGHGVEGVIKANTFRTHLMGLPQKTLFPKISRINHACNPNAMLRFSSAGGLMAGVGAFRDIKPGEEITISCNVNPFVKKLDHSLTHIHDCLDIPQTDTSEERRAKIREWGFTCSCNLCSASKSQIAASDERRRTLERGIELMVKALQRGDAPGAIRILRKALRILEDEGLESLSADVYESLARIYWVIKDKRTATKYAQRAVDYRADFGGSLEPRNRTQDLAAMLVSFDQ